MNPLLMPLVAYQGRQVERRTIRLPEASGPREGVVGTGGRPDLKVAVVGESTAAGCGVERHEDGFAGHLALALTTLLPTATIAWSVHARSGATAATVRRSLADGIPNGLDLAVLLIGANDVLTRTPSSVWRDEVAGLLCVLQRRAEHVAIAGPPPFDDFPALPRVLGRYLRERGDRLGLIAREVIRPMPGVSWVAADGLLPLRPDFFARDGFHPGALGYRRWAEVVATVVSAPLSRSSEAGLSG